MSRKPIDARRDRFSREATRAAASAAASTPAAAPPSRHIAAASAGMESTQIRTHSRAAASPRGETTIPNASRSGCWVGAR
jgi:hypothetical protein